MLEGILRRRPAGVLTMPLRVLCAGLLCVMGLLGCGGRPEIKMAPIAGTVTYDGKPLTHGRILLMHRSGKMGSGEIGLDGRYRVEAPVGECNVMITCTEQPDRSTPKPAWDDRQVPRSLIPQRYSNYETSGFKVTLVDGENTRDWKLED